MAKVLQKIPKLLSSKVSIFIYLFLFFYLVLFAFLTKLLPALSEAAPSDSAQLILGNYTNVLSALGASIAAGNGVAMRHNQEKIQQRHEDMHQELTDKLEALHQKIEEMNNQSNK